MVKGTCNWAASQCRSAFFVNRPSLSTYMFLAPVLPDQHKLSGSDDKAWRSSCACVAIRHDVIRPSRMNSPKFKGFQEAGCGAQSGMSLALDITWPPRPRG